MPPEAFRQAISRPDPRAANPDVAFGYMGLRRGRAPEQRANAPLSLPPATPFSPAPPQETVSWQEPAPPGYALADGQDRAAEQEPAPRAEADAAYATPPALARGAIDGIRPDLLV